MNLPAMKAMIGRRLSFSFTHSESWPPAAAGSV
jgi:hypothetical protein